MAAAGLSHAISSLLSVALLTSGGSPSKVIGTGQYGYSVAQVQAELGVLGFNPGPVTGEVSLRLVQSATEYMTDFGMNRTMPISEQINDTLKMIGTVPDGAHGALTLAVEADLMKLGLYHGTLRGQWSSALETAIAKFQLKTGEPASGTLTAPTLEALAHLTAVAVTAYNRWSYSAEPGDSLALLAWVANLPYQGFLRANDEHGSVLWVGQPIHWYTKAVPKPPSSPPVHHTSKKHEMSKKHKNHKKHKKTRRSSVVKSPSRQTPPTTVSPPPSTSSISPGVLANLKPIADLVVINPTVPDVVSLVNAESTNNVTIDVALTGEWALLHPSLVKELVRSGNEVVIDGYSGSNLNTLPKWGVSQEVSWSLHAIASVTGTGPAFLILTSAPNATVMQVADSMNVVAMSPNIVITQIPGQTSASQRVQAALLTHSNQVVEIDALVNWGKLFLALGKQHFVFETLGQIWANE